MQNPATHPFRCTFIRFDGSGGEADLTPARAIQALEAMIKTVSARQHGEMKDPRMMHGLKKED